MTMPAQMETIVLRRTFEAPVERVYHAWTDASSLMNWWTCGQGLAGTLLELDVRVGGKMRVSFGNPGEEPSLNISEYLEVIPNRLLVFNMTRVKDGIVRAETRCTVEFHDLGGRTEIVLTDSGLNGASNEKGWTPTLASLGRWLLAPSTTGKGN